jgi:hypothetical protein
VVAAAAADAATEQLSAAIDPTQVTLRGIPVVQRSVRRGQEELPAVEKEEGGGTQESPAVKTQPANAEESRGIGCCHRKLASGRTRSFR